MASSAAHISVTTGASVHAPHGQAHNKTKASQGDSFADMLAVAGGPEENARATAAAPTEKAAADTTNDRTAETAENRKAPDDRQASAQDNSQDNAGTVQSVVPAPDQVAVATPGAEVLTDTLADTLSDANAANDNAPADTTAPLPQPVQPTPAQPAAAAPALTLTAPAAQNTVPGAAEAGADAHPELAPVAGATLSSPRAARPESGPAQPAVNDGKTGGAAQPATEAKAATARTAAADAGAFQNILHDAASQADAADAPPAIADMAKPAEAPAAAKPSPELNTISLAVPAAPAHANAGAEKLAAAVQTAAPSLPQATPDVNQFAVDVAARSQSGAKQFDIRLDPPELGRVEVRLSIDVHGKAEAHLTADQPQTLELLQKDAPALARALREAGLNVNQDGLNFSLKNQQQQAGGEDPARGGGRAGFNNSRNSSEPSFESDGAYVRRGLGVLDIRV